jgi:endoglucanase
MIICVMSLFIGFTACTGTGDGGNETNAVSQEHSVEETESEPPGEKTVFDFINEAAMEPREPVVREPREPVSQSFDTSVTAAQIVKDMKIGWNLGNTFDGPSETGWAGVRTTPEIIGDVKAAGFDTLRLPVTWGNNSGRAREAYGYIIDENFMDRIEDVVNYALDHDMYVILNSHHDEWVGSVLYENAEYALQKVWEQISERFKGYDERLLFETMNEPRRISSDWSGDEESRNIINTLNKVAVDAIRASGGNNEYRFILVPGYAASADYSAISNLIIPNGDPRIIASVHAYNPGSVCMPGPETEWGTDQDIMNLKNMFDTVNEVLVSKGIPAVLGEFGTVNKNNEETRALLAKYTVAFATQYDILCIWWDNNGFGNSAIGNSENFGLYHRSSNEWRFPLIVDALMEGLTWTPELPEEKGEVLFSYDFNNGDYGITVELDNGAAWKEGVPNTRHTVLDGVGVLEINSNYHGEWEITRFNLPSEDIPKFSKATKLKYEILMPRNATAEIGWAQFSTCLSTSKNGWMQSNVTRGLSTASFNADYFRLPMEEDLSNVTDSIEGAEYFAFLWINYGWIFEGPIYLTNITFMIEE